VLTIMWPTRTMMLLLLVIFTPQIDASKPSFRLSHVLKLSYRHLNWRGNTVGAEFDLKILQWPNRVKTSTPWCASWRYCTIPSLEVTV